MQQETNDISISKKSATNLYCSQMSRCFVFGTQFISGYVHLLRLSITRPDVGLGWRPKGLASKWCRLYPSWRRSENPGGENPLRLVGWNPRLLCANFREKKHIPVFRGKLWLASKFCSSIMFNVIKRCSTYWISFSIMKFQFTRSFFSSYFGISTSLWHDFDKYVSNGLKPPTNIVVSDFAKLSTFSHFQDHRIARAWAFSQAGKWFVFRVRWYQAPSCLL